MAQSFERNLPSEHMVGTRRHAGMQSSDISTCRQQSGRILRIAIAIASFVIYAWAVVLVETTHPPNAWSVEADAEIPAALSYAVYGSPLMVTMKSVLDRFHRISPLFGNQGGADGIDQAVQETAQGSIPGSIELELPLSGNGIAYPIFASVAMAAFGARIASLYFGFLLIMAASNVFFLLRFQDSRAVLVPIVFTALTVMLATPLVTDKFVASQIPIGGIRYFSIAGMLPLIHLWYEFGDGSQITRYRHWYHLVLLALQTVILSFVMLARVSFIAIVAQLALLLAIQTWWLRSEQSRRSSMTLAFAAAVSLTFIIGLKSSLPDFAQTQSLSGSLWDRAFIGLTFHPAWPFPGLREKYDCTYAIPKGLSQSISRDQNAHCVWMSQPTNRLRPPSVVEAQVHSAEYEEVLRDAFIYIVYTYPRQVIALMIKYRPLMVLSTLRDGMQVDWANTSIALRSLIMLQAGLYLLLVWSGIRGGAPQVPPSACFTFVLASFALPTLLIAWSRLWTSLELIFAVWGGGFALLGLGIQELWLWWGCQVDRQMAER
jgi:hypothetical protein